MSSDRVADLSYRMMARTSRVADWLTPNTTRQEEIKAFTLEQLRTFLA